MSQVRNDQTLSNDQRKNSEKKKFHRLKRRSSKLKPKIWIGKTGVTDALIEQLNKQLKSDKLVKVKTQKVAIANEDLLEITKVVAAATASSIVDVRGSTFTLYKPKTSTANTEPAK
ncbi:YhbY family RNA-binding protein [[Eubacterium] cellulosolvens]